MSCPAGISIIILDLSRATVHLDLASADRPSGRASLGRSASPPDSLLSEVASHVSVGRSCSHWVFGDGTCGDRHAGAGRPSRTVSSWALTIRYGRLWLGGAMLFQAAQFSLHAFYLVTDRSQDRSLPRQGRQQSVDFVLAVIMAQRRDHRARPHRRSRRATGPRLQRRRIPNPRLIARRRPCTEVRCEKIFRKSCTAAPRRIPAFGARATPLPTGRSPSVRMGDIAMTTTPQSRGAEAGHAPGAPRIFLRPLCKAPGWTPENLQNAVLGRSHRSKLGKARLKEAIDRTREVLEVPDDYPDRHHVPGSDTGAVEMAMWSMLGPRPVQLLAFESFGKDWVTDVTKQLKLDGGGAGRSLRRAARPDQGARRRRPGLHLERHNLGRARPERRFHRRRPRGDHHLRRHQRRPSRRTSTGPSSMW